MPRIPSYRRHRSTKRAVVTLNGRDYYLGRFGTKESRQKYAQLIKEHLNQDVPGPLAAARTSKLTIAEAAVCYLDRSQQVDPPPRQSHVRGMLRVLVGLYENELAANMTPADLREVRKAMIALGWSRTYVNEQVNNIRRMFKWLGVEGLIPTNVYHDLKMLEGLRKGNYETIALGVRETEPITPVDDATVEATLSHLPEVVADIVKLQRLTGMRPAEACQIRPRDIDRLGDVWVYRPRQHKTEYRGKNRVIYVGPMAQTVLLKYLARDPEMYCFRPCDSEDKRRAARTLSRTTPESCGNRVGSNRVANPRRTVGDKYNVTAYRRAIHRACDKAFPSPNLAGADLAAWKSAHRWSPNQLRHTAATEIRKRFGLEAAQVVLGHSHANVTQVYAERDLSKGIEVARRIG